MEVIPGVSVSFKEAGLLLLKVGREFYNRTKKKKVARDCDADYFTRLQCLNETPVIPMFCWAFKDIFFLQDLKLLL